MNVLTFLLDHAGPSIAGTITTVAGTFIWRIVRVRTTGRLGGQAIDSRAGDDVAVQLGRHHRVEITRPRRRRSQRFTSRRRRRRRR